MIATQPITETPEQFAIRAHRELLADPALPADLQDPDIRNEYVWKQWEARTGKNAWQARDVMDAKLDENKYHRDGTRCQFMEHSRVNPKTGMTKAYTADDLAEICHFSNQRAIQNRKFTALSEDHTPDDPSQPDPRNVGWVGNYRVGMVTNDKFGVFGDEYHHRKFADLVEGRPQRSVELITQKDTGERFFDPIATLSTKTPRLPLPIKYSGHYAIEFDREVDTITSKQKPITRERFSVVDSEFDDQDQEKFMEGASAFPGGSNTALPAQKYGGGVSSDPHEAASQMFALLEDHPLIAQLKELMPALQKMVASNTQEEYPVLQEPEQPVPAPMPAAAPMAPQQPAADMQKEVSMAQPMPPMASPMAPMPAPQEATAPEQFGGAKCYSSQESDDMDAEKFAELQQHMEDRYSEKFAEFQGQIDQLSRANEFLATKVAESEAQLEIQEENAVRERRVNTIDRYCEQFGESLFNRDEVILKYAADELASEEVWDQFVDMTDRYAEQFKANAAGRLPSGEMPNSRKPSQSQTIKQRRNQLIEEAMRKGEDIFSNPQATAEKFDAQLADEFGIDRG